MLQTAEAPIQIFVDCPPPPEANDQTEYTGLGEPLTFSMSLKTNAEPVTFAIVDPGKGGEMDILMDLQSFSYAPNETYCSLFGQGDPWMWRVKDPFNQTAEAVATIIVDCPGAPIAVQDLQFVIEPQTFLKIDLQIQGTRPFRFEMISEAFNGLVTNFTEDGWTSYTPNMTYCR